MTADMTVVLELVDEALTDPDDRDREARSLRRELLRLDVTSVSAPTVAAPPDSRSGSAELLGVLAVVLPTGATVIRDVLGTARAWAVRRRCRVKVSLDGDSIEISRASRADIDALLDAYLSRHHAADTDD